MTHQDRGVLPGWYDDATGSGAQRWWDGQRWTEYRRGAQPPAQHSGGAAAVGALYPQPVWPGYQAAPPARRRTSRVLWLLLLVFVVWLVGSAVYYAVSRGSGGDWYQKGYDEGMKTPLTSSAPNLAVSVCSGAVVTKSSERVSSSHKDAVAAGCHDAIQERLVEMERSGSS
jgi:hypothetical protein